MEADPIKEDTTQSPANDYSVGIDLGGTQIKAGLVLDNGGIIADLTIPSQANDGAEVVARNIAEAIHSLLDEIQATDRNLNSRSSQFSTLTGRQEHVLGHLVGIGIGTPGLINPSQGMVHFSPNFEGWCDIPLVNLVQQQLKPGIADLPIHLENDGNAMAYGELRQGAGIGLSDVVCLTLGTGVGGGIIIDGQIFHGSRYVGAELGHTIIFGDGRRCSCSNYGCLEAYVGGGQIVERTRAKIIKEVRRSPGLESQLRALTPQTIAEAAVDGDPIAIEIFAETARYIGIALTSFAHILNPQMVIIGGGVAAAGEKLLFEPIRVEVQQRAMDTNAESLQIVAAKLGNRAGLVGAAMLAQRQA